MPKEQCPHCPKKVPVEQLDYHIALCIVGKNFACDVSDCGKRFASPAGVTTHKSKYHTADELKTKYKCRYCEFGTNDEKGMIRHEMKHKEAGGDGFSRARSRSRGFNPSSAETIPARPRAVRARSTAATVNRSNASISTPKGSHSHLKNDGRSKRSVSRSRSRSAKRNTWSMNRRGKSHSRFDYSPSRISPERRVESSRIFTWASLQPTGERQQAVLRQSVSNHEEFEMGDELPANQFAAANNAESDQEMPTNPSPMDTENATAWDIIPMISINIINREEAHLQMRSNWDQLKQVLRTIRTQNHLLREKCREDGTALGDDFIEEKIRAFEAEFGQI